MERSYNDKTHTLGRIWVCAAILLFLAVPMVISIALGTWPAIDKFMAGFLPVLALYGPVGVIEFLTYTPMLGTGGLYVGFVTGNLSNLKVPCALNALNATDTKPTDEAGEIVTCISVCVCSIVTTLILVAGVLGFSFVSDVLNSPVLAPAFANILPALFGGLGFVYIARNPKLAALPVLLMLALYFVMPSLPVSILIPVSAIVAVVYARLLYKKGKI